MRPTIGMFFLLLMTAAFWADKLDGRVLDCSACHRRIADEWRGSGHAVSYTAPLFVYKLKDDPLNGPAACSCHNPDFIPPGKIGRVPDARSDSLELGVDCISCHMDQDLVAYSGGPDRYVPHWVRTDSSYADKGFCAGCHGWGKEAAVNCQDCHMAPEHGPATDHPVFGRPENGTHKSHRWPGVRDASFLARGFLLEARKEGGQLSVNISNAVGAHAFPVSRNHQAEVLVFSLPGEPKNPLWRREVRLAADSSASYDFPLPSAESGARLELRFFPAPALMPDSSFLLLEKRFESR